MKGLNTLGSWVLLMVFLAGVPTGAVVYFHDLAFEHPLLALGSLVLYWFVLVLFSLGTEIGRNLRIRWGEELAEWLDLRVQWLVSRYYKRYREYLIYQHRDLDMRGLGTLGPFTLSLEQIFVQLKITPQPPPQYFSQPYFSAA